MTQRLYIIQEGPMPSRITESFEKMYAHIGGDRWHRHDSVLDSLSKGGEYRFAPNEDNMPYYHVYQLDLKRPVDLSKPVYVVVEDEEHFTLYDSLEEIYHKNRAAYKLGTFEEFMAEAKKIPTNTDMIIERINWSNVPSTYHTYHWYYDHSIVVHALFPI